MEADTAEVRRRENAKKAREAADLFFPGEKWKFVEDGIYLSSRRPIGKHSSYHNELRDARILRDWGSTVYLVPDIRSAPGRKYDAIVNGLMVEFKNMHGASTRTLKDHFLDSREQAPNVFINLENSPLTWRKIINALYATRNSLDYGKKNKHEDGRIILKIKGQESLVYLYVADLKT